ncbi:MAG: hypothetical protein WDZ50_04535 [Woeseia sp.]
MVWRFRKVALTVFLLGCAMSAHAQSQDVNALHWAYSTYFGSGWYQIGDESNAFALRYVPRKELSQATIDDAGNRHVGIELRFPVTLGLNNFPLDDLAGSVNPENFANVSITPAVYLTWPVTERWTLRPIAALGWGTLLNGDESAWTYWSGVRSQLVLLDRVPRVSLFNSIGFVGYAPSRGPSENFWPITTALELRHPVFRELAEGNWYLYWHLAYTWFQDDLDLVRQTTGTEPISDQWDFGFAFSREETPISIWRLEFDRLGLSYRFSSDGELQGIGLVFSALFDQ